MSVFIALRVGYDGLLTSIPDGEDRGTSQRVAFGPLDLDDVCALVGEKHTEDRDRRLVQQRRL